MKKHFFIVCCIGIISSAFGQQNEAKEDIALIKQNLVDSKEKIKKYGWIETTTTYVKGEEKSKKQNQCYYAVDGSLTKVPTGGQSAAKKKGGIRGKIAANKQEDMEEYIQKCIAKVQTYLPPDPQKIQQLYQTGKSTIHVLEPGKKFKFDFNGYQQEGDILSISLDKGKKLITGLSVNTYIDDKDDKVIFNIKYNTLPDGTQYPAETALEAQAKSVKIVIQNTGYKKGG